MRCCVVHRLTLADLYRSTSNTDTVNFFTLFFCKIMWCFFVWVNEPGSILCQIQRTFEKLAYNWFYILCPQYNLLRNVLYTSLGYSVLFISYSCLCIQTDTHMHATQTHTHTHQKGLGFFLSGIQGPVGVQIPNSLCMFYPFNFLAHLQSSCAFCTIKESIQVLCKLRKNVNACLHEHLWTLMKVAAILPRQQVCCGWHMWTPISSDM